ncbi:15948_t:CDS:2, partial [Racocetra persica]
NQYYQQIRPSGSPYGNTIPYGQRMPTTHAPAYNQPAMNISQDPRVSSGSSNNVVRSGTFSVQPRTQYPQSIYPNPGFYNVPYDPRRPPPQQAFNVHGFQRPNGPGVQRMDDVKALYDYKTTANEEIPFLANDVIAVLSTNADGWWEGELLDESRKKRGLFP